MSPNDKVPDIDALARSMLVFYGAHDDHDDHGPGDDVDAAGTPRFPIDAERYALIQAATERDSQRYLHSGLAPVDCRRCGATVEVKKLGPAYTAVQWDSAAMAQCAHFAAQREQGVQSSRNRGCPHLSQSIRHAVAEGLLEETCSAPAPGDGID